MVLLGFEDSGHFESAEEGERNETFEAYCLTRTSTEEPGSFETVMLSRKHNAPVIVAICKLSEEYKRDG